MRHDARQDQTDFEFDPPRDPRPGSITDFPSSSARLIANPFLAFLGSILAWSLMSSGLKSHNLTPFLAGLSSMLASILLIQYHCLDCGKTGWAIRAKRHPCLVDISRSDEYRIRRRITPRLQTQLKFWFIVAMLVACAYFLSSVPHR